MLEGLSRFPEDILFPSQQLQTEIFELPLVHELFVLGRTISRFLNQRGRCFHRQLRAPYSDDTRGAYSKENSGFNGEVWLRAFTPHATPAPAWPSRPPRAVRCRSAPPPVAGRP